MLLFLFFAYSYAQTQNCTACGYSAEPPLHCCDECFYYDTTVGQCAPSCGYICQTDSDCGADPFSPCSACVEGQCQGNADYGNCTQENPWTNGPQAPILPSAWRANFTMVNYTDNTLANGNLYYDIQYGGLRLDFYPNNCPLIEAQSEEVNNGDCSIIFYKGNNYYVYPQSGLCCGYPGFPVWRPDVYRVANASFGGVYSISGVSVDYWRFQYTCPWIRPPVPLTMNRLPAYTVQRDVYLKEGSNIPVRINETLTSGYSDYYNLMVGDQDESIFTEMLINCLFEDSNDYFLRVCNKYPGNGRLLYLGYS